MSGQARLNVKVVNKIEDLPPRDWNSIFPKVLENYYFFKTLDESHFNQFTFFYILVYDNNLPVGATSCFVMDFPIDIAVKGFLQKPLGFLKKIFPRMCNFKTLMCGLPMSQGRIGVAKNDAAVVDAIRETLEKIAKEQQAPLIIFKDFNASYDEMLEPILSKGYLKIESLPSTDMEINFKNFDEYLKTLSQSSRENLKRNFKKVDGKVKIDMAVKSALEEPELKAVHELYLQTYDKQDIGLEKLPLDFFKVIAKNMPDETRFFLWSIENKIVAFAFCLISESYFIDYYLGFDYSIAHKYFLYFVRFRDLLNWCLKQGVRKYEMGVTTYEPKRRLGFNFVRLYFYIKHRNRLINKFSGVISYFVKPENFDTVFGHMDESCAENGKSDKENYCRR